MAAKFSPASSASGMGKTLIFLLLASIGGIVVYKYYAGKEGSFFGPPKAYQLKYLPADFELDINSEEALRIISDPQRYKKEFDELVYNINTSILRHVSNRMGLSDSLKNEVLKAYEKHHPYLRGLYYNDFMAIKDTSANLYETWYDNAGGSATRVFEEVASKYTCFLVNDIMATVLETKEGKVFAKGSNLDTPCGIAMGEALQPLIRKLEERAAIEDFSRARGLLQEKVEKVISELATYEVRDKKGINKQLQTKIWGFSVSSTDLEITAISILKVGFRLNDYFDIDLNARSGVVTVTLPEPVVLSHEVYPKIEKLDIGWLREVKEVNFNESFNALRGEFRREALESNVMDKAKSQASELMVTMFEPLVSNMSGRYKLKVNFRSAAREEVEPDPLDPESPTAEAERTLD
jgi:hypothetical protein